MKIQRKNIFIVFLLLFTYINPSYQKKIQKQQNSIVITSKQSQLHAYYTLKNDADFTPKFQQKLNKVPIIKFETIPKVKISYMTRGYSSQVYLWSQRNLIVKFYKKQRMIKLNVIHEIKNLIMIDQIYPNFLKQIIVSKNQIIGFILQRVNGKTLNSLYSQNQNVLNYDMAAKLHLISLIRQEVRKLQNIKFVHGDLLPPNIIVDQNDKKDSQPSVKLIDFGNSYVFSYDKLVKRNLGPSGQPPQYKKYYNASGVNAYQFGLCSLMIILNLGKTDTLRLPSKRQIAFNYLRQKGLTQNEVTYIKALLSRNIDIRNKALFSEPDTFAKELFQQSINKK